MAAALLIYVIVERVLELVVAGRNTRRLVASGAQEVGASHYPIMVALHVTWLVAVIGWVATAAPTVSEPFFTFYAILQGLRFWVMASLGKYWTTRIITLPNMPLVKRGPYRFLRHPNYIVVALEVVTLPLVYGAWHIAVIFSALNGAMLWFRIDIENRAIGLRH